MHRLDPEQPSLTTEDLEALAAIRKACARDILMSTTLAGCGHPGGSLSTLDFLLVAYATLNLDPATPQSPARDRLIVSHGHISPATYAVLSAAGFVERQDFLVGFRRAGNRFGGHVETHVPGVEWSSGNLGQGLAAGVGSAIGLKNSGSDARVVVCMGDGEQQKGQVGEARRLAAKYELSNLLAMVDHNGLQIGGSTDEVMPQDVVAQYVADGWNVLDVDGHDHDALHGALRRFLAGELPVPNRPTVIVARTVMGMGIPWMENDAKWHGQALKPEACKEALAHLGFDPAELDELFAARAATSGDEGAHGAPASPAPAVEVPPPHVYEAGTVTDCRSAYGKVMADLADANNVDGPPLVYAFSCDLEGSVKLGKFRETNPDGLVECGIQEHTAAVASGRLSREGFRVFFSTFGAFAVSEVYNQLRLNDYNGTNLKVVTTHCGLDVGEDGPTHQCLDYAGLMRSTFGWAIFLPADPNQCDRIVRHVASREGNALVAMGRSKMPMLLNEDGSLVYDADRPFQPGLADVIREGDDGAILAAGPMVHRAVEAHDLLAAEGKRVRVVNMASLRPLDADAVRKAAATGRVLTAEDHNADTGLGSAVANVMADEGIACRFARAGASDFATSGKPVDLYRRARLDGDGLAARFRELF